MNHRTTGVNNWDTGGVTRDCHVPRDQSNVVSTISYIAVCVMSTLETAVGGSSSSSSSRGVGRMPKRRQRFNHLHGHTSRLLLLPPAVDSEEGLDRDGNGRLRDTLKNL